MQKYGSEKAKMKAKLEDYDRRLQQLQNQKSKCDNTIKYLSKKEKEQDAKARAHRLINKGGVIEHFYPKSKVMTDEAFYNMMQNLSEDYSFNDLFISEMVKAILTSGGIY